MEAQIAVRAPRSSALETATVIPRSLKDPVGFRPSYLTNTSASARSLRRGEWMSGVEPSLKETIGVVSDTGDTAESG